jgi:hypothetical protein
MFFRIGGITNTRLFMPRVVWIVVFLLAFEAGFAVSYSLAEQEKTPAWTESSRPQQQAEEYRRDQPKTVVELQQFRQTLPAELKTGGSLRGNGALINLNPTINSWLLLQLQWGSSGGKESFHLENPRRLEQQVLLEPDYPYGLVIVEGSQRYECDLWSAWPNSPLLKARSLGNPYVALCQDRLYLRSHGQGHYTTQEWVTNLLRDNVWQGESMIGLVKSSIFKDAFLDSSPVETAEASENLGRPAANNMPLPADVDPAYENQVLTPLELGITFDGQPGQKLGIGKWYRAHDLPGVFVSSIKPDLVSADLKQIIKSQIQPLDGVESKAGEYLVAFSLNSLEAGFAMGSEHPGVDWSERVPDKIRDSRLPGPDGIGNVAPLVNTGIINPIDDRRVIATFTAGFKRHHGAFRYAELASINHGSHYGFIENGVVLSKLQPNLATFLAYDDGRIDLKTWRQEDERDLAHIRFARQNGVPIIDYDQENNTSKPGRYVRQWTIGNWSGAEDSSQRTLRAGLCLQERDQNRFLIYGYFSSATPSAMAQVFQAYHCKYAMHLDMNALEHTYLALYRRHDDDLKVEHLIKGMEVVDKESDGRRIPRFIGYPDNRDFFYLMEREGR